MSVKHTLNFCPVCGECLNKTYKGKRGRVLCGEHGEIYIDVDV